MGGWVDGMDGLSVEGVKSRLRLYILFVGCVGLEEAEEAEPSRWVE